MRNPWLWGGALAVLIVLGIAYMTGWIGGGEPAPSQPAVEQPQ